MQSIEVILFGKGIGESVLLNCGNNHWIVIDCCMNLENSLPAPLEYLRSKGLSEDSIKQIVISHFHNDHIVGMNQLIQVCPNADVFVSKALSIGESLRFFAFQSTQTQKTQIENGLSEFIKVSNILESRNKSYKKVSSDQLLYQDRINKMQIYALSPSDQDCRNTENAFQRLLFQCNESSVPAISKNTTNHNCITVLVSTQFMDNPKNDVLLGADLEITKDINSGWDSVVNCTASPDKSVKVFKIPHHGSQTAYHPTTWDKCMLPESIGILTTYDSSSLPREEYLQRYKGLTTELYSTTVPKCIAKKEKSAISRKIDKIILEHSKTVIRVSEKTKKQFGYIRVGKTHTEVDYTVELFGDAISINEQY